jgi:D-alanyl-D-alanine carboxypeptidase
VLPVYSISKPFLAQAILELNLDLKAAIGDFVPDLAEAYKTRPVASLLNHTSGLDDYSQLTEYNQAVANSEAAWSEAELLERCERLPHQRVGFHYSNIGYLLLRQAMEHSTGLGYFQSLEQLVFKPLGISGFAEWAEPHEDVPNYDPAWVYSGTFLAVPDAIAPALATLAKHRANTLGLAAGLAEVPYPNTGFEQPGYNFGFMANGNPPTHVGHGGGGPGFQLMALVNTNNWNSDVEISQTGDLDQAKAIEALKARLA